MFHTKLFFIVSLLSASALSAMSSPRNLKVAIPQNEINGYKSIPYYPAPRPQLAAIAEMIESEPDTEPTNFDEQEIHQSLELMTKDNRIKNLGQNGLLGLSACMVYSGNYVYALGTLLSAACMRAPQKVDAIATQAIRMSKVVTQKVCEKTEPYAQRVAQQITKENCGRAMNRCPNTCQKFASLITFGYYQPIHLRTR